MSVQEERGRKVFLDTLLEIGYEYFKCVERRSKVSMHRYTLRNKKYKFVEISESNKSINTH